MKSAKLLQKIFLSLNLKPTRVIIASVKNDCYFVIFCIYNIISSIEVNNNIQDVLLSVKLRKHHKTNNIQHLSSRSPTNSNTHKKGKRITKNNKSNYRKDKQTNLREENKNKEPTEKIPE